MNKCPKCGNTNLTIERRPNGGTICNICLFSGKTTEFNKELTTAEKLLWLVENRQGGIVFCKAGFFSVEKLNKIQYFAYGAETDKYNTFEEAINTAYNWAKEK